MDPCRKTKACPKTYVGCPTCRPGEALELAPDKEHDVSLNVFRAQRQLQIARHVTLSKTAEIAKQGKEEDSAEPAKSSLKKSKDAKPSAKSETIFS